MSGASMFFLLSCGAILVQAISVSADSNSNSNVNTNQNTNGHHGYPRSPAPFPYREYDYADLVPVPFTESMRRQPLKENLAGTAAVAADAAEAALQATKPLVHDLCEAIVIKVANAVARSMRRQRHPAYRRNYNRNSNSNTNDLGSVYRRSPPIEPTMGDIGRYYDPVEDDVEQSMEAKETTTEEAMKNDVEAVAEEEVPEAVASKSLASRGWGQLGQIIPARPAHRSSNDATSNLNSNSNQNSNRRNSARLARARRMGGAGARSKRRYASLTNRRAGIL